MLWVTRIDCCNLIAWNPIHRFCQVALMAMQQLQQWCNVAVGEAACGFGPRLQLFCHALRQ